MSFFGEVASSWDNGCCVRTRAIPLVHTKAALPETRNSKSTRPSHGSNMGFTGESGVCSFSENWRRHGTTRPPHVGGFFVVVLPLPWNYWNSSMPRRLYILLYNSFWLASVVPRRTASIRVTEIWLLSKSCPKGRIWAS